MENNFTYTVQELTENHSFIRWVKGEAEEEAFYWDGWIEKDEINRQKAQKAQKILTGVSFENRLPFNVEQEWETVQEKLEPEKNDFHKLNRYKLPDKENRVVGFLKVAAIIAVVFTASWFLVKNTQVLSHSGNSISIKTITTKYKEKKTITFSDGSKITLAAGSKLSYVANWLQKPTKHLKLKGEAYFSIKHRKVKNHPKLVITTADGTVSDWGTQFAVSTYGNHTQVVLKKGVVKIDVAGDSVQKAVKMAPGELANFNRYDSTVSIKQVNPRVYTSWAFGKLVFDHTPLSLLVKRIKHAYGVQVKVESKELLAVKLSGSVNFESLDMLMHAVNQVLDITMTRKGKTVYINSSK